MKITSIPTWNKIKELAESGELRLINIDIDDITGSDRLVYPEKYLSRIESKGMCDCYGEREGVLLFNEDGNPYIFIYAYEACNPFIFGDVVVLPGHDYIICFNKLTGETSKNHIR